MTDEYLEARLDAVMAAVASNHEEMLELKAASQRGGLLSRNAPVMMFFWSIVVGLVSVAFFIAQLASAQASLAVTVQHVTKTVDHHIELDGHPVMQERVKNIERLLNDPAK